MVGKMVYKMTRSFGSVAPDVIANALRVIDETHNGISPSVVVDAARPKGSALHDAFQWNDKKAAEEHRLHQARQMCRALVIVNEETQEEAPVYVHVRSADPTVAEGQYLPAAVVAKDVDLFARALSELQGKSNALLRAIANLESLAREGGDSDRMMRVSLAVRALETANSALSAIH